MKRFAYAAVMLIVLGIVLTGCRGERLSLDELLNRGVNAAQSGDWETAKDFASRAVKVAPSNVNALILYALSLENTGDADAALGEISKAVSIDEANYFAQYTKGRLFYEKKRFESCIAPLRAALNLRPNATDPLILLAQSSVYLNNAQDARIYYSRLARNRNFAKNPAPWSELGMNFIRFDNKPAQAGQYLVYAYRLQPENPTLLLNLAVYFDTCMRNRAEARKYYTRFLKMTEQNSAMRENRKAVGKRIQALR